MSDYAIAHFLSPSARLETYLPERWMLPVRIKFGLRSAAWCDPRRNTNGADRNAEVNIA